MTKQVSKDLAIAKAETPVLWPPHAKSWLIGKDSVAGRDWGQEEKRMTEDEMVGWHHWLDGRESEWTPGVGDGQGGLACCNSVVAKSWRRLSDWTELKELVNVVYRLAWWLSSKEFSAKAGDLGSVLGGGGDGADSLENEMINHSSILAWEISWTEEPGGLQLTGLQTVGHDWANTHTPLE